MLPVIELDVRLEDLRVSRSGLLSSGLTALCTICLKLNQFQLLFAIDDARWLSVKKSSVRWLNVIRTIVHSTRHAPQATAEQQNITLSIIIN